MTRAIIPTLLIFVLTAAPAFAADRADLPDYQKIDARAEGTLHGVPLASAKADSVVVYGGIGTQEGKFEQTNGAPDWQGWTSIDYTHFVEKWSVSDFNCADIGAGGPGNHAWWCGETFEYDCGGTPEGYGNSWVQLLEWTGTVADLEADTEVCITWDMNWDTEYNYDFVRLLHDDGSGFFVELASWDDVGTATGLTMCFTMSAGAYAGADDNEVIIRFEFTSDGAWSDEDCLHETDGACQIDDIEVTFDTVLQGTVEDCDLNPLQWQVVLPPWVGDFAKLWTGLDDADICRSNTSAVAAFIDDGQLEGLDGSPCITHCYGPSGYIVNTTGGLAGPGYHLDNHVVSPKIAWPAGYDGALFEHDVYTHFDPSEADSPGLYRRWDVRSTVDPTGESGWSGWVDYHFVQYGGPYWLRESVPVTSLLEAGRTWVQCQMGVYDLGWVWGYTGNDGTPAPYYDNVKWTAFQHTGPAITAREIELAQDNFPTIDDLDLVNLENNSIRFDIADDIALVGHDVNDPGDSIVVHLTAVRTDSYLDADPQMYWRMKANSVFDEVRTLPTGATQAGDRIFGVVVGDTAYRRPGVNSSPTNKWFFDLPDEGFFFPGDVIHYYIRATDMVDGVGQGVSLVPGDTAGYDDFSSMLSFDPSFTVRGLPSVYDDGAKGLTHPKILFWNDFANRGAEDEWYWALSNLGYGIMTDYDVYYTNGPSSGVGNGLGGRACVNHIDGYETILYSSENLAEFTITSVDWEEDKGDDIGLLNNWLALGDKDLVLFGDDILFDLEATAAGAAFMSGQLGLSLDNRDLNPLIDYQKSPTVGAVAEDPVFSVGLTPVTEWIAYGGCFDFNTFDAVIPTTAQRLAYFEDLDGQNPYPYSAASLREDEVPGNNLFHFPYGFANIYTPAKAPTPSASRTKMLEKILLYLGSTGPGLSAVPGHEDLVARNYPNPFNPSTRLAWSMPAPSAMTIEIFNIRGGKVRTLIDDEMVEAADKRTWDGRDDAGVRVASGVYFAKIRSAGYEKTLKLALVK